MVVCRCVHKYRNKQGQIYGYRLQDLNGNLHDTTPDILKNAIYKNQITVLNLQLTSNGRLMDKAEENKQSNIVNSAEQREQNDTNNDNRNKLDIDAIIAEHGNDGIEVIITSVYIEIVKNIYNRYNSINISRLNADALAILMRVAAKHQGLKDIMERAGVKPMVFKSYTYDEFGITGQYIDEKNPDINLGIDISAIVRILFNNTAAYLYSNTPLETTQSFISVSKMDNLADILGIKIANSYYSTSVLVLLSNEDIEISGKYGQMYRDEAFRIDPITNKIAPNGDKILKEWANNLSGEYSTVPFKQASTRKRCVTQNFIGYTFLNDTVRLVIMEYTVDVKDSRGEVTHRTELYTVRDPETLKILSCHKGADFTDCD